MARLKSRRCLDSALRPYARGAACRRLAEQSRRVPPARHVPSIVNRITLIKWATRARPSLVMERLPLWAADPSVRFLFTLDEDDGTATPAFIDALGKLTGGRCKVRVGNCRGKVEACDDGLAGEDWGHVVILASDDMVPQSPYYARLITALFYDRFPEGDGVLHLNDGRTGRHLNTLCVADRGYFDRTGYLYRACPKFSDGYLSVFCDNEFQEVSERLGRACYVDDVIIRHDWIGQSHPDDKLHRRNESYYHRDEACFLKRRAAGFPREPVPGVL